MEDWGDEVVPYHTRKQANKKSAISNFKVKKKVYMKRDTMKCPG
jgi:hypothetical protein